MIVASSISVFHRAIEVTHKGETEGSGKSKKKRKRNMDPKRWEEDTRIEKVSDNSILSADADKDHVRRFKEQPVSFWISMITGSILSNTMSSTVHKAVHWPKENVMPFLIFSSTELVSFKKAWEFYKNMIYHCSTVGAWSRRRECCF